MMLEPLRQQILQRLPAEGESGRLFHGRGHCFPGYEDLLIDYYPPVALVTLYRPRDQAWLGELCSLLAELLADMQSVWLQERFLHNAPGRLLSGNLPPVVDAVESGLRFRLRLGDAQNIGFFPDMSNGRRLVRERSSNRSVLNLFAYTCSFSVAAMAGGASRVVNLDMNRGALDLGRLNHQLNRQDLRAISFLPHELFRSQSRLRRLGPFDLIVCDPPATQGKSFTAERHWPKLVRRLPELLSPGGEVLTCLSAPHLPPRFLDDLFLASAPALAKIGSYTAGAAFPEKFPERGLNLGLYRLDG
jgi:23S rRNA (cytosine1962-C5)-methyltransferase